LFLCLSAQSRFRLSAAAAGRNAFGMQLGRAEADRNYGINWGIFGKDRFQKLNPWNPVNPVQFFFQESFLRE
jgi:hypothetical protein